MESNGISEIQEMQSEIEQLREENSTLRRKMQSEIEDHWAEKSTLQEKNLQQSEESDKKYKELETKSMELSKHYVELEKEYIKIKIRVKNLRGANEQLNNTIDELEQKITEIEVDTPPRPTSEKKAHRLALVETVAKDRYKFVRVQEKNFHRSLQQYADERNMPYDKFKDSCYVTIWEDCPHPVDSVDNTICFLREHDYEAKQLEVTWTESRAKLELIVEAFLNKAAGGKEAAMEILRTDTLQFETLQAGTPQVGTLQAGTPQAE